MACGHDGYRLVVFALLTNLLLFAARSRRGRRLLFVGALSTMRLLRSPLARRAYAAAWAAASDPRPRRATGRVVRSAAGRVKRR